MPTFRELSEAAYCPRQRYYRRQDSNDFEIPPEVEAKRQLAFEYSRLLDGDIDDDPIEPSPGTYLSRLRATRERLDAFDSLMDPEETNTFLDGKDCRGIVHKILSDPFAPSLIFTGDPPDSGVWEPQSVRLLGAALALAYEYERPVEVAFAEYPAHGIVRRVSLSARRRRTYRAVLRTIETMDGPPSRTPNRNKCSACEYRSECGVRTRSLRSLLS